MFVFPMGVVNFRHCGLHACMLSLVYIFCLFIIDYNCFPHIYLYVCMCVTCEAVWHTVAYFTATKDSVLDRLSG